MRKYLSLFTICFYSLISNAQNVGIGTSNPQNKLHVAGGFRLDTLTGVNGAGLLWHNPNGVVYGIKFTGNTNDVLRGDGTFGTYSVDGNIGWLLNGNSGTSPTTNFLGTTDNQPLLFRVNNVRHGYLGNSIFLGSEAGLVNTSSSNIGIGTGALRNNTLSSDNIAIGHRSMYANSGGSNTALGTYTLEKNTFGGTNIAIGNYALNGNTEGNYNVGVGYLSLGANTSGSANTSIGNYSLRSNSIGNNNTASGYSSLEQNTNGSANSAFGNRALNSNTGGYENTAVGSQSLRNNNSYYNSGFGASSLASNTSGHDNTALGYAAMYYNQTTSFNTSVGAFSLYNNLRDENTAVGYKALEQNTYGTWNTAVGVGALQGNTQSSGNAAFGKNALNSNYGDLGQNSAFGYNALRANTTGYGNTAVGNQAALNNVSGRYNTAIGFVTAAALPNNVENTTCIGYATGWNTTSSNQVNIGNFSVTWIGGQTGWFHYSDKRIKNDIKDDVPGLAFITRLKPITYHVDIDKQEEIANAGKIETTSELIKPTEKNWEGKYDVEKIKMSGFFAQEVEEAAKAINYSFNGVHNPKNGGLLSLDYSAFVVPLVKAVQEQQGIIEKQQKQIDDLIKRLEALEKK